MKQKVSMQAKMWSITLGVLGSAMVLNGCNGSGGGGVNVKPLPAAIVTATPLATATPVGTATRTPAATATPSPTATPISSPLVGRYMLTYKYTGLPLGGNFAVEVRQDGSVVGFAGNPEFPTAVTSRGTINLSEGTLTLLANRNDDNLGAFTITFTGNLRKQQNTITGSGTLRNSFGATGTFTVVRAP